MFVSSVNPIQWSESGMEVEWVRNVDAEAPDCYLTHGIHFTYVMMCQGLSNAMKG